MCNIVQYIKKQLLKQITNLHDIAFNGNVHWKNRGQYNCKKYWVWDPFSKQIIIKIRTVEMQHARWSDDSQSGDVHQKMSLTLKYIGLQFTPTHP